MADAPTAPPAGGAGGAHPTRPGEVTTKDKIKLPLWAWALVGGGALVIGWRFYQAHKAQSAATTSADGTTASTTPPTTIIGPSDNGSYVHNQQLFNAIKDLQGAVTAEGAADTSGQQSNGITVPSQGQTTELVYRVTNGDTWASVAQKFGLSESQLRGWNAASANRGTWGTIDTTGKVKSGDTLVVPWLNVDLANYNGIRKAQGLPTVT